MGSHVINKLNSDQFPTTLLKKTTKLRNYIHRYSSNQERNSSHYKYNIWHLSYILLTIQQETELHHSKASQPRWIVLCNNSQGINLTETQLTLKLNFASLPLCIIFFCWYLLSESFFFLGLSHDLVVCSLLFAQRGKKNRREGMKERKEENEKFEKIFCDS